MKTFVCALALVASLVAARGLARAQVQHRLWQDTTSCQIVPINSIWFRAQILACPVSIGHDVTDASAFPDQVRMPLAAVTYDDSSATMDVGCAWIARSIGGTGALYFSSTRWSCATAGGCTSAARQPAFTGRGNLQWNPTTDPNFLAPDPGLSVSLQLFCFSEEIHNVVAGSTGVVVDNYRMLVNLTPF
jgi:hypothetical protein